MPRVPSIISQQPTAVKPSVLQSQPAFPLEQTGSRQGNQTQQNAKIATARARANPFADGNMLPGVQFTNGVGITLNHGLGRAYVGFFIVNPSDLTAGAPTAVITIPITVPSSQIMLGAQGTFIADVWVY